MSNDRVTITLDNEHVVSLLLTINRILSDREVLENAEEVLVKAILAR